MSDQPVRKTPTMTSGNKNSYHNKKTQILVEPEAESKRLDKTKLKYDVAKNTAKISVGTKPLSKNEKKEFSVQEGSSLNSLRISSPPEKIISSQKMESLSVKPLLKTTPAQKTSSLSAKTPHKMSSQVSQDQVKSDVVKNKNLRSRPRNFQTTQSFEGQKRSTDTFDMVNFVGLALTALWFVAVGIYTQTHIGIGGLFSQSLPTIGGLIAGAMAPIAILWMIISYVQKGGELRQYKNILKHELRSFSKAQKADAMKAMEAIDLSPETKSALNSLHKVRAGLREEIKYLNDVSAKTGAEIHKLNSSLDSRTLKISDVSKEVEKRTLALQNVSVEKLAKMKDVGFDPMAMNAVLAKTEGLSQKMDVRMAALKESLGKMQGTLGQIETKGADTADKISKAVLDSTGSVNSLEKAISNSIEKLSKTSQATKAGADNFLNTSSKQIDDLNKVGDANA